MEPRLTRECRGPQINASVRAAKQGGRGLLSVRRAFCRPVRDVEPWVLHPTEESGCPDTEGLGGKTRALCAVGRVAWPPSSSGTASRSSAAARPASPPAIHESCVSALELSLLLEFVQVFFEKPVRHRHKLAVPPVVASFVAGNQKDGGTERVERIERPQGSARALCPKLAHLRVTRAGDFRAVKEAQGRAEFHEMPRRERQIVLRPSKESRRAGSRSRAANRCGWPRVPVLPRAPRRDIPRRAAFPGRSSTPRRCRGPDSRRLSCPLGLRYRTRRPLRMPPEERRRSSARQVDRDGSGSRPDEARMTDCWRPGTPSRPPPRQFLLRDCYA